MNLNPIILQALDGLEIPVFPDFKNARLNCERAQAKTYIVFNLVYEQITENADNLPFCEETVMDVHLFTPELSRVKSLTKKIKDRLVKAGLTLDETVSSYEEESGLEHTTITVSHLDEYLIEED